jgi:FixJ family two-component response regulator
MGMPSTQHAPTNPYFISLIMLLDLELPGLSELEVLGHIQSRGWTLPVIVLSSSSDVPGKEDVLRSGARTFMSKPPDSHLLLATIEKVVREQAGID